MPNTGTSKANGVTFEAVFCASKCDQSPKPISVEMYTINPSDSQDLIGACVNVVTCHAGPSNIRDDRVKITQAIKPPHVTSANAD